MKMNLILNLPINMKYLYLIVFAIMLPNAAFAAAPTPPPGYEPSVGDYATQLPEYLPNGAVNLDEAWIQYGGARLYWNSVRVPTQIKLAGAMWVDPASVPELVLKPKPAPRKRVYRRAPVKKKVAEVCVPADVASTALKTPAIPVPVTPVEETKTSIPPLKATSAVAKPKPVKQAQARPRQVRVQQPVQAAPAPGQSPVPEQPRLQ